MGPLTQEGVLLNWHFCSYRNRVQLPPDLPLPYKGSPVASFLPASATTMGEDRHRPAASPHWLAGWLQDGGGDVLSPGDPDQEQGAWKRRYSASKV